MDGEARVAPDAQLQTAGRVAELVLPKAGGAVQGPGRGRGTQGDHGRSCKNRARERPIAEYSFSTFGRAAGDENRSGRQNSGGRPVDSSRKLAPAVPEPSL